MFFGKKLFHSLILTLAMAFAVGVAVPAEANPGGGGGGGGQTDRRSSGNPAKLYQEGVEALKEGNYRKAERRFRKVLDAVPDDPVVNYMMGLALMGRERPGRAVRYFRKAVREKPDFIEAQLALGEAYVADDELDDAREQLGVLERMLAECEANNCGAEDEAACADEGETAECDQTRLQKLQQAVARLKSLIEGKDVGALPGDPLVNVADLNTDNSYLEAVRLINEGRFEAAISGLYEARRAAGPHADIFNYLGFAHRKLGQFAEARAYYARALAFDPDHLGAHEYLGELYVQTGEIDKARAQLTRLDELCAFGCAEQEDLARAIDAYLSSQASLN